MPAPRPDPTPAAPAPLARPVTTVWGVGPERAAQLARLNIRTVEDLLRHRPRRYEDRRRLLPIRELEINQPATVRGRVVAAGVKTWKRGTRSLFECVLEDGTARLHLRWWQAQPWMEDYYTVGREFLVFGAAETLRPRMFEHPECEPVEPGEDEAVHVNRVAPVHPLTEGLTARAMRALVWRALERLLPDAACPAPGAPAAASPRLAPDTLTALRWLHFPDEPEQAEMARRRLAFEEFLELQRALRSRRRSFEARAKALPCGGDNRLVQPFLARLGFKLTDAQTRALREIRGDLRGAHPMRRLLHGDVGSGKTVAAACAALMALESGFNAALMAPTGILAEQHFQNFQRWFAPLGAGVELRTGNWKTSGLRPPISNVQPAGTGNPGLRTQNSQTLFIGTHALLTAGLDLPKLGLVIIDEQHKFGAAQRERLVRKGRYPHLLMMTATPIPRTLGLTLYGDLDVSTIDAPPPGRGRVRTFVRTVDALPKVWEFARSQLAAGRQAYVVYPRVEETDAGNVKAVAMEFEAVQKALAPFRAGLLHGRMAAREKDAVMAEFRSGAVKALLTTLLVEAGVDVPNATVMVIENAERFGLAQLHQLRGRIGRGARESYCVLLAAAKTPAARERLRVLEETNDGFRIAEADLDSRGPGELLGQQQSGAPRLRFGDLTADLELIRQAREQAWREA